MSILRNEYDLEKKIDKNWYESSNVLYSEFVEDKKENKGNLTVVFKNGKKYLYKDVLYLDYLGFKRASLGESNGKSLNAFIIKKYPGEKDGESDVEEINEELNAPVEKDNTYYIHGEGEVDDMVFEACYAPTLEYIATTFSDSRFIIKNWDRYGEKSVKYLLSIGVDADRITVYSFTNQDYQSFLGGCRFVNLEQDDFPGDSLDFFLIRKSFEDVAYVSRENIEAISKLSRSAAIILKRRFV